MKFNVSLDKEQISNITADKVLETVKCARNKDDWYESEIKTLKADIQKRDSMLVQRDLIIERLREHLRKMRGEINAKSYN